MKINLNLVTNTNYHFLKENIVHSLTDKKTLLIAAVIFGFAICAVSYFLNKRIKANHLITPDNVKQQFHKIEKDPAKEKQTQNNTPIPEQNKNLIKQEIPQARQTPALDGKPSEQQLDSTTINSKKKKEEDQPINGKDFTPVINTEKEENVQTTQVIIDSDLLPIPVQPLPPKKDSPKDQVTSKTQNILDLAKNTQIQFDIRIKAIDRMLSPSNLTDLTEENREKLIQMRKGLSELRIESDSLKFEQSKLSNLRDRITSNTRILNNNEARYTKVTQIISDLKNKIEEKKKSIIDLEKNLESISHGIFKFSKMKISYQPDDVLKLDSGASVIARDYKGILTDKLTLEKSHPLLSEEAFLRKNNNEQLKYIKEKECVYVIKGIQYDCRISKTEWYNYIYQLETRWNQDGIIPSIEINGFMLNESVNEASIINSKAMLNVYRNDLVSLEKRLENLLKELKEVEDTIAQLKRSLQEDKPKFNENDLKKLEDRIAELKTKPL